MEISPGIHWIDGGASNMYLCVEDDSLTLVDCGMPKRQGLILQKVQEIGREPPDLKHILVTHADQDHVGSLAAIQAATGARIFASAETIALLTRGEQPKHLPWLAQFILERFMRYQAVPADLMEPVSDGDILPFLGGIQVLASPGHTMDHHAFYCSQAGVLFAGDALNTRNGRINRSAPRISADQDAATHSAITLLELAPAVVACGHGKPLTSHSSDDLMKAFNTLRRA